LLPELRGAAPIQWSILNGDEITGVTAQQMDIGIDTGDILMTKTFSIPEDMNAGELFDVLSEMGADVLMETIDCVKNGTLNPVKQDDSKSTYASMLSKELCPTDFSKSAKDVHNQIRGLYPFPTSYTTLNGEIIKICESRLGEKKSGSCGEIISIYDDAIGVMCSDREIIITKVKPAGKKEMSSRDFINGRGKDKLIGIILC
jgi:methionyl-tRNA formyltransferase